MLRGEGEGRTPRLGESAWEPSAKSWGRGGASEGGGQTGSGHSWTLKGAWKGRNTREEREGTSRPERGKNSGLGVVPPWLARPCILGARRSPAATGQFVLDCLHLSVYVCASDLVSASGLDFLYLSPHLPLYEYHRVCPRLDYVAAFQ